MSKGLFSIIKEFLFGEPKPPIIKDIWRTDKEEYIRSEKRYTDSHAYPIEYYKIYAVYQSSLTTQNKRIIEVYKQS